MNSFVLSIQGKKVPVLLTSENFFIAFMTYTQLHDFGPCAPNKINFFSTELV